MDFRLTICLLLFIIVAVFAVDKGIPKIRSKAEKRAVPESLMTKRSGDEPVVTPDSSWSGGQKEADSYFVCDSGEVMIGRKHDGDENGDTWYKCGKVYYGGDIVNINPLSLAWSNWQKESQSSYECPGQTVMVGRQHQDDENGETAYQCGNFESSSITLDKTLPWTGSMKESNSQYDCPTNHVMFGRRHSGDENGQTSYRCAALGASD